MKLSKKYSNQKVFFISSIKDFASDLQNYIINDGEWTIKGFIDIFENIYSLSSDTKIISKILELNIFPRFLEFAEKIGYRIELASKQNYYPDLSFISKQNEEIKFAVDIKTTYADDKRPGYCNGFTLGSHGEYFSNRESRKNIQFPYDSYIAHLCLGIIYSRNTSDNYNELKIYTLKDLPNIPSVINNFIFFVSEKWRIASDKGGSGNTANIGSIKKIEDIIKGNGVFAKAGEDIFDDYWVNYGKIRIKVDGKFKKLTTFDEYIRFCKLPKHIKNE
ncbi:MAG: EcoRV family type II restriction endonuclease [Candidatus Cloacimonetes bacterium]|nr:EcoRV family type II restriction endonuclease [Candidatus Cloacimonadota bacterium]